MCFLEILSKLFRLAIGELTEDRDIRREEKCKFESMLKAYLPGTIIAPCTSQWLRISTKSNTLVDLFICVCGGGRTYMYIYTQKCMLPMDTIAGSSMNGLSTIYRPLSRLDRARASKAS